MGLLRKKSTVREYGRVNGVYTEKEIDKLKVRPSVKVAALAAAALALFSDSAVDIMGDRPQPALSKNEIISQAAQRYDRTFQHASPAGKFALQFLTRTDVGIERRTGGNGLLGAVTDREAVVVRFNDGCLSDTAYDIDGGHTSATIRGLFVAAEVEASVPTAAANAYVGSDQPDMLVVSSGHANSIDLRFSGVTEGNQLTPVNQQTRDVLATYGCNLGVQGEPVEADYGVNYVTSEWVVE